MLSLRAGDASVVVAPEIGGALLGWTIGAEPILRHALPDAILTRFVRGLAGFPLVPYCNRIAYGRFHWDGQDYQLDRNFGDHPHPIHGTGWQSAWTIEAVSPDSVALSLVHHPEGAEARRWPFAFRAGLHFTLSQDALRVTLRVRNLHGKPAPAGLGLHPFFPRSRFHTLRFSAKGVWRNGSDALPSECVALPAEWDHGRGRGIGSVALDNCFVGWDGAVHIEGRAHRVTIEADETLRHVQVYTPEGMDFFCVEPVSHMPDALNHPEHPMRVLAPSEALEARISFLVAS